MAQITNENMWAMYIQALSQISGVPNFKNLILFGTSTPTSLNTATQSVLPTTPIGVALAQIYRYGNLIPKWSPFYTPSGNSDVFGQYEAFVSDIQLEGNPDPAIDAAITSDRQQRKQFLDQYQSDYNDAYKDYQNKNQIQPNLYKSFNDFLNRTSWGSILSQDTNMLTGAQSQLNADLTRKYGADYLPIQNAVNMVNNVLAQESSQNGTLVMSIQTDANANQMVPLYNPGPLGNPGFSQWLDQVVVQAGQGVPPHFAVSINQSAKQYDLTEMSFFSEGGGLVDLDVFFWGAGEGEKEKSSFTVNTSDSSFSITITMQSVYYLPIDPGHWFMPSILGDHATANFFPGSALSDKQLWGPNGIFNIIPAGLIIAFRPTVSATFDSETYQRIKTYNHSEVGATFGIGPFFLGEYGEEKTTSTDSVRWHDEENTMVMTDSTTIPKIIGMIASTPNWK